MEPHDIARRTFAIGRRGYDREEVDAFLAKLAQEVARLRSAVAEGPSSPEAAYGNVGSHVSAVLAAAAKAAEDMRIAAEEEAAEILDAARKRAAEVSRNTEENLGKARETKALAEREAALLRAGARDETAQLVQEAESKAALIEAEAKERASKLERIARVNVETILAEGRAQYGRLHRATQLLADRLASLEIMIHDVRTEVSTIESEADVADPLLKEDVPAEWLDAMTGQKSELTDGNVPSGDSETSGSVRPKSTATSRADRGKTRSPIAAVPRSSARPPRHGEGA